MKLFKRRKAISQSKSVDPSEQTELSLEEIPIKQTKATSDALPKRCPYCNKELVKMPQRKTKCPFCEKPIFVKRRVDENIKRLVTKEEADRIQEEWNARYSEKSFNSFIDEIGMGKAYIDQLHVKFKQKTGDRYSVDDFKIQLINQRIDQLVKKHDYHAVKILYNKLYNILWSKDLDYYHPLKMTCFFELLEYKQGDIFTSVEISITNPCEECKKLDGKIFSLEDMIKDSILPNQKCLKKYCSCVYLAVIDE